MTAHPTQNDLATRQLTLKYVVDPNCGFFSFESGVPKD